MVVLVTVGDAWPVVAGSLPCSEFELVVAGSAPEAIERLAAGGIDAVVADLRFADSTVPSLLESIRNDPSTRATSFVCCRFLPSLIGRASLRAVAEVCGALGAHFLDYFDVEQRQGEPAAADRLRRVLRQTATEESAGRS